MKKHHTEGLVTEEQIVNKIILIRGMKVMVDRDLAELYGVTTKRLNEQVKRNRKRFPADFMFQLTKEEKDEVVAICDHLKSLKFSPNLPFVFTEHGTLMLANVLNSEKAILVNIQVVRVFIKMRELILANKEILQQLEKIERKIASHDSDILLIFKYLKQLLNPVHQPIRRIGFRRKNEEE